MPDPGHLHQPHSIGSNKESLRLKLMLKPESVEPAVPYAQPENPTIIPQNATLSTPYPPSPPYTVVSPLLVLAVQTVDLNIKIPRSPSKTKGQHRVTKIRKAATERWKNKLQRSFPNNSEMKAAYPGKLLRHYKSKRSDSQIEGGVNCSAGVNRVIRPTIAKSSRVETLQRNFSVPETTTVQSVGIITWAQDVSSVKDENIFPMVFRMMPTEQFLEEQARMLEQNWAIANSEEARTSARKNFGWSAENWTETWRAQMVMSGHS